MSKTVISVEHLTKKYNLGVISTGTLQRDINRWWARVRGRPDPEAIIGKTDHSKRMGDSILALDDVSFTVQQGETLGIIGRNGAGKSTLLKILSQVTAPTSGVVKVKGRIGSLLEVGTGFHPELTGRENVYLNGAILGMRKEEVDRKFGEIVDFSGVEQFIDTPVKRYSSGMYVRLAFAVAAHLDPEILIVDEVLAVGDAEFQKKCLGKMSEVADEGRTVLFVSHNMGSIRKLCSSGILLGNGKIEYSGEINKVVSSYISMPMINKKEKSEIASTKTPTLSQAKFLTKIELRDNEYKINNSFFMGQKMIFRFYLRNLIKIKEFRLGISINSLDGHRIIVVDTDMDKKSQALTFSANDIVDLHVDEIYLTPGSYSVDFIIAQHIGGRLEFLENVLNFDVIADDVFENGYLINKAYGFFYCKNIRWSINN